MADKNYYIILPNGKSKMYSEKDFNSPNVQSFINDKKNGASVLEQVPYDANDKNVRDDDVFTLTLENGKSKDYSYEEFNSPNVQNWLGSNPKVSVSRFRPYNPYLDEAEQVGSDTDNATYIVKPTDPSSNEPVVTLSADEYKANRDKYASTNDRMVVRISPDGRTSADDFMAHVDYQRKVKQLNDFEAANKDILSQYDKAMNVPIYLPPMKTAAGYVHPRQAMEMYIRENPDSDIARAVAERERLISERNANPYYQKERKQNIAEAESIITGIKDIDDKSRADKAAKKIAQDAEQILKAPSIDTDKSNGFENFLIGHRDTFNDADFWTMGISAIVANSRAKKEIDGIREKLQGKPINIGDITPENDTELKKYLNDDEIRLLKSLSVYAKAQADRALDTSNMYQAGMTAAQSLEFMAEFLMTGGVSSAIKKGTTSLAVKGIRAVGRNVASKTGRAIGYTAVRGAEALATPALQAAATTYMHPSSWRNLSDAASYQFDQNTGELANKDFWTAFKETAADNFIETWSEMALDPVFGVIGYGLGIRKAGKTGLFKQIKSTPLGQFAALIGDNAVANTLRKAGFHGYVEEMLEEVLGAGTRQAFGVDDQAWEQFWEGDNLGQMAVAFIPMSLVGSVGGSVAHKIKANKTYENEVPYIKDMMRIRGYSDAEIDEKLSRKANSMDEIAHNINGVVSSLNDIQSLSEEEKQHLIRYAAGTASKSVFDAIKEQYETNEKNAINDELEQKIGPYWVATPVPADGEEHREVREIKYADGNRVFITSAEENEGQLAAKDEDGRHIIIKGGEAEIASGVNDGTILSDTRIPINDFLNKERDGRKKGAESARMDSEYKDRLEQVRSQAVPGASVNIGTAEAPVAGTIIGWNGEKFVVESAERGAEEYDVNQMARKLGLDLHVNTDAENEAQQEKDAQSMLDLSDQINEQGKGMVFTDAEGLKHNLDAVFDTWQEEDGTWMAAIMSGDEEYDIPMADLSQQYSSYLAEKNNPASTEGIEETEPAKSESSIEEPEEDNTPRDFRGNPLPLKDDGTVDRDSLWNNDPEAWAKWNDENPNRRIDTKAYVQGRIDSLTGDIKKLEKAIVKETKTSGNFDAIDRFADEIDEKRSRQAQLQQILDNYAAAEKAAADKEKARQLELNEPQNITQLAVKVLQGVKARSLNKESFKRELGWGNAELAQFFPWWAKKGKGITLDGLAEQMVELDGQYGFVPMVKDAEQKDTQAAKDAIIDVMQTISRPGEVRDMVIDENKAFEDAQRNAEEAAIEADVMSRFGLTMDEYNALSDEEKAKLDAEPELTEQEQTVENGPFGPIFRQFVGKAKEAIEYLRTVKTGEAVGALSHPSVGNIDLVWGEEGSGRSDGYGLSKLLKYHPEVVDNLQGILDDMSEVSRSANRVNLESDKYKAAVRLTWDEQRKTWLLTAFEKKNSVLDNTTDTDETLSSEQNDTATLQNTVSESKDTENSENTNIPADNSAEVTMSRDQLLEQVITFLRESSTDDVDIEAISRASNEELSQLNRLYEEWIPFNDKFGETYNQLAKDLKSKHKATKDAAQAAIDSAEKESIDAFAPIQQYFNHLMEKYGEEESIERKEDVYTFEDAPGQEIRIWQRPDNGNFAFHLKAGAANNLGAGEVGVDWDEGPRGNERGFSSLEDVIKKAIGTITNTVIKGHQGKEYKDFNFGPVKNFRRHLQEMLDDIQAGEEEENEVEDEVPVAPVHNSGAQYEISPNAASDEEIEATEVTQDEVNSIRFGGWDILRSERTGEEVKTYGGTTLFSPGHERGVHVTITSANGGRREGDSTAEYLAKFLKANGFVSTAPEPPVRKNKYGYWINKYGVITGADVIMLESSKKGWANSSSVEYAQLDNGKWVAEAGKSPNDFSKQFDTKLDAIANVMRELKKHYEENKDRKDEMFGPREKKDELNLIKHLETKVIPVEMLDAGQFGGGKSASAITAAEYGEQMDLFGVAEESNDASQEEKESKPKKTRSTKKTKKVRPDGALFETDEDFDDDVVNTTDVPVEVIVFPGEEDNPQACRIHLFEKDGKWNSVAEVWADNGSMSKAGTNSGSYPYGSRDEAIRKAVSYFEWYRDNKADPNNWGTEGIGELIDYASAMPAQVERADETVKEKAENTEKSAQSAQEQDSKGQYGANNKLVTNERYEELKKRMIAKMNQLNLGFDPETLAIGCEMAAYHIEAGARKFIDYAERMIADLGDAIKPYLKALYNGARDLPGMEEYAGEMDSYDAVSATDVNNIGLENIQEFNEGDLVIYKRKSMKVAGIHPKTLDLEYNPTGFMPVYSMGVPSTDVTKFVSFHQEDISVQQDNGIQGMDGLTEFDIYTACKEFIDEHQRDGLSISLVDMIAIGSRKSGTAREDSDLDILLEYQGDVKEDAVFNALNSEPLEIMGVKVDFFPIREEESGNIASWLSNHNNGESVKTDIEEAREDVNIEPSEAQKKAGNYKMGHVVIDGYEFTMENPKGSVRKGVDENGTPWEITMNNDYGYIRGTIGVDGDHIDMFLSDSPEQGDVYVVDQVNPDGSFDEHKVMYGFNSVDEAKAAYLSNYSEGWQGLGAITPVSKDEFKKWIESSKRKTKPFAEYATVKPLDEDVPTLGTIETSTHEKTGKKQWIVKPSARVTDEEFAELKRSAKDNGGFWYGKKKGFIFYDEESANKFNNSNTKEYAETTDEQTAANTDAIVSKAESIAEKAGALAESDAEISESEIAPTLDQIDGALDAIDNQLALLGEYDTRDDVRKAGSKLATALAIDLGLNENDVEVNSSVNEHMAMVDIRVPAKNGFAVDVSFNASRKDGEPYKTGDEISVILRTTRGIGRIYGALYIPYGSTYAQLLKTVKDVGEGYLPAQPSSDNLAEAATIITQRNRKKEENSVSLNGDELVGDLFSSMSEDQPQSEPDIEPSAEPKVKRPTEINGFKIGDTVLYTRPNGTLQEQVKIVDFEDGRPVIDSFGVNWISELADWENIEKYEEPTNTDNNGLQGTDAIRSEGSSDSGRYGREDSRGQGEDGSRAGQESGGSDRGREGEGSGQSRTVRPRLSNSVKLNTNNNRAERGTDYAPTNIRARYNANVDAIRLMKQLVEREQKATKADMAILRQFSGWGGLGTFFNNEYSPEYRQLKDLLTDEEMQDAKLSINSAYYTPAPIIDGLWDIAKRMGFEGGKVLEGSAGIGNILGLMPKQMSENSEITAVEIDSVTGNILKLLYPDATVHIKGFQDVKLPNNSVDLAITNVPFVTGLHVYDAAEKDLSNKFENIHDFCIAKNVRKLKEGGIGIFITSRGTLDKSHKLSNWVVNEGNSDFIGAFRLNNKTFGETPVTSDIIVIRKRVNAKQSAEAIDVSGTTIVRTGEYQDKESGRWNRTTHEYEYDMKPVAMEYNTYFVENPQLMAGEMKFGYEMGDTFRPGSSGLFPKEGMDQQKLLNRWVKTLKNTGEAARSEESAQVAGTQDTTAKEGQIIVNAKNEICVSRNGKAVPVGVNDNKVKGYSKVQCVKDYDALKAAVDAVIEYQQKNEGDEGLSALIGKLNRAYDLFTKRYGYLNKNTSISFLRNNDVDFASIAALEDYKETEDINGKKKDVVKKTDIFSKRIIGYKNEPTPQTAKDGVIVSIQQFGRIDMPYIASKLGRSEESIGQEILEQGLAFVDPASGMYVPSYEYLSGNVRTKLEYATSQNEDGKYDRNIEELKKVVPFNIPAHQIEFSLGSDWIPASVYEEFARDKYGVGDNYVLTYYGGEWHEPAYFYARNEKNRSAGVTSNIVDKTVFGHDLMLAAMNNKSVDFSKKTDEGMIYDKTAQQAAQTRIDEIRDEFVEWFKGKMNENENLREKIEKDYNEMFNNYVPKDIADEYLQEHLDGANKDITLYPHQKKAVIRGTTEPLLLAHEVGSGKTFTLISTAMEMRRLGTAKKPMVVVQNSTVGQFVSEAKKLYPAAKVLTVSEADRTREGRAAFYAKIKYNDWDLIIVPQSVFEMIPDSEERKQAFIQEKIDEKLAVLALAQEAKADSRAIKAMKDEIEALQYEREHGEPMPKKNKKQAKKEAEAIANTTARTQKQMDRRTDEISDFDDMGIDALLVDEAHAYKKLGFATNIKRGVKGVDASGSKRSAGLYLKSRSIFDRCGWKNVVFATGTPISNTAAEIWTFMKYLMPSEVMKSYHIYYFDDFVKNFGKIQTALEFGTNGKFKESTRFASYGNVPELVRIWSSVCDTVLSKDAAAAKDKDGKVGKLSDKLPKMTGVDEGHPDGRPEEIFLPQSSELVGVMKFVRDELERFEHMSGDEKKENSSIPLVMYGVAKRAAIDTRLVVEDGNDEPMSKTNKAVEMIVSDLKDTAKYNGTVAVFCDNYRRLDINPKTGKKDLEGFNIFDDIKTKLVAAGIPENQIAIVRSGKGKLSDKAKEKLFAQVNSGEVRVIMGSTQTLGTGVNIQQRLHLAIHMDTPDRPMDVTQRNGRILRQGNLHKDWNLPVRVVRMGVEDSLDVTGYQRLDTKSRFINSIMNGKTFILNSRNVEFRTLEEEEDDMFSNPVAVLSGSQYALLKSKAERDLRKYQNKLQQHKQDQVYISSMLRWHATMIESERRAIANNEGKLEKVGEFFPDGKVTSVAVNGMTGTSKERINEILKEQISQPVRVLMDRQRAAQYSNEEKRRFNLSVNGTPVTLNVKIWSEYSYDYKAGESKRIVHGDYTFDCEEFGFNTVKTTNAYSLVDYFNEEVATGKVFSVDIAKSKQRIATWKSDDAEMRKREGVPFADQDKLDEAKAKVAEYTELMRKEMEEKEAKYKDIEAPEVKINLASASAAEEEVEEGDVEETHNREMEAAAGTLDADNPLVVAEATAAVRRLQDRIGVPVRFVRGSDAKGHYTEGKNEVVINIGAHESIDDVVETYLHEAVAHYGLRELMGEEFDSFIDSVWDNCTEGMRRRIRSMMRENGWRRRYAVEEYIAELAQKTDYNKNERSLWRKIVDAVRSFINSISGRDNRITDDTIREILTSSFSNLEEMETIKAAAQADGTFMKAPNGAATNLNEKQWLMVRTRAFKEWFGDWEGREFLLSDRYISRLTGDEFEKDAIPLTEKVAKFFKKNYNGQVIRNGVGTVILDSRSVRDSIAHGVGRNKAAAFAAVPDVITSGIEIDRQSNWKGRGYDSVTIAAPISIKGEGYVAVVVLTQSLNSNRFYLHEVALQKNLQDESFKTGTKADLHQGDIANVLINFLNTSKIVDENGEPKVVYHGANSKFNEFKTEMLGSNTEASSAKEGFFFTDKKDMADWFRQNSQMRSASGYDTFVEQAVQQLRDEAVPEKIEDWLYVNVDEYEDENMSALPYEEKLKIVEDFFRDRLNGYYSSMDEMGRDLREWGVELGRTMPVFLNMRTPIVDEEERDYVSGKVESAMTDVISSAKAEGKDGVIFKSIIERPGKSAQYVVFSPTQIKSATENNGDFDGNNPDIRFRPAYHGSAADFDKFDLNHVGEGEGAQAHGYGIYVTFDKNTGIGYANKLAGNKVVWDGIESYTSSHQVAESVVNSDYKGNIKLAKKSLALAWPANMRPEYAKIIIDSDIDDWKVNQNQRNLYSVEIPENTGNNYIDEEKFYKPGDDILVRIASAFKEKYPNYYNDSRYVGLRRLEDDIRNAYNNRKIVKVSGEGIYRDLSDVLGSSRKASAFLNSIGIVGITYEGVRDGECAVIFDSSDVEIMEHTHFRLREKPAPKKTGIGYKVFFRKNGKLYPPMVANPNGEDTPVGVWLDADAAPVAGESKTGRPQVKAGGKGTQGGSGQLAYRPGWHLGTIPYAIQFNRKDENGNKTLFPKDFVWAEVEYAADKDYQKEAEAEGINASGKYQHSLAGLKRLPEDGFYMYRTNPNPETDPWIITGAMKVNKVLTRAEVDALVREAGREPQRVEGESIRDRKAGNVVYNEDRKWYESPVEFANRIVNSYRERYNEVVPAVVVSRDMSKKEFGKALGVEGDLLDIEYRTLKSSNKYLNGAFDEISGKIIILANENDNSAANIEDTIFHENLHAALKKFYPGYDLQVGKDIEEFFKRNGEGGKAILDSVEAVTKEYSAEEKDEEKLVFHLTNMMLRTEKRGLNIIEKLPAIDRQVINTLFNAVGYDIESERVRRRNSGNTGFNQEDEEEALLRPDVEEGFGKEVEKGETGSLFGNIGYKYSVPAKREIAERLADKLHVNIEVVSRDGMPKGHAASKGVWDNGRILVCLENNDGTNDVAMTVIHEAVGHNGLRKLVGNENMDNFCMDLYRKSTEDVRRAIIDYSQSHGYNFVEGTEEYLAHLSETMDFTEPERTFWDQVKDAVRNLLSKVGINIPIDGRDLRWILWQSYNANKRGELANDVARATLAHKLGFTLKADRERDNARRTVRDRIVEEHYDESAAAMYNRAATNWRARLKETWIDQFSAVDELVKAVEKASGKAVKSFEDVRKALNQQSSKGLKAMERWENEFFAPLKDAVKSCMNVANCSLEDVERYVMLKHGLERNDKFAKRDAREFYQVIFDSFKKRLEDNGQIDDETKEKLLKKEQDKLKKHLDNIENGTDRKYLEFREKDYGGLTSLYSDYEDYMPFNPEAETEEEFNERVNKARKPRYETLAQTELAAEQEVKECEDKFGDNYIELWARINAATKDTLKHQYESNMLSKSQYEYVRDMFDYYVPLRGFKETTAEDMYSYYMSDQSRSFEPPLLKAKGRSTEAESPFGHIGATASSAIAADMKNQTKLSLYYMVSNRAKNDLVTVSDVWYENTGVDELGRRVFTPVYPEFSDDLSSADVKKAFADWEAGMQEKAKSGFAFKSRKNLNLHNTVISIDTRQERSHVIKFKVGGEDKMMFINGNPRAAQAINGELNVETSADYQKVFGKVLRWFSGINTSYNPEFWLSNMQRDTLMALMSVNVKEDAGYNAEFKKNFIKSMKAVVKLNKAFKAGKLGNSQIENWYREFAEGGGITGYTTLKKNEEWELELRKYTGTERKSMAAVRDAFDKVQQFGEAIEQMTRFAAFMTSREQGKSIVDSVADAKELTVNFNRKGSGKAISWKEADKLRGKNGGKLTGVEKALLVGASWLPAYGRRFIMFFNASVQGLNTMYNLMKSNKKRFGTWTAAYLALGMMNAAMHALLDDDDDYLDIPDYERRNNLLVGAGGTYFKWAMPQETRIFYGLGDMIVNHALGRTPDKNIVAELLESVSDIAPLNPAGGLSAIAPSALTPIVELAMNRDYKGSKIYNDMQYLSDEEKKRTPKYLKAYKGTGRVYVNISQALNWLTGGDYTDAGFININPAGIEHLVEGATGGAGTTIEKFIQGIGGVLRGSVEAVAGDNFEGSAAEKVMDWLGTDEFMVRNTPFLRRILTINDERYRNAHTTDLFNYYKAEAEHTKKRMNQYINAGDEDKFDKLMESGDIDVMNIYNSYKSILETYNTMIREAGSNRERKELVKEQDEYRKEMIKEISEIK